MGVKTFLVDRLLGDLVEQRVGERVEALREATGRQREDDGWRRITDQSRDLAPATADRMREIAVYLYTRNPIARRMINIIAEWVVGEGITFEAPHPKTAEYLAAFWGDGVNRWELLIAQKVRELHLFGEQFWPAFANPYTGRFRLGVLDPARVKEVVLDPLNALIPIGVVTKMDARGQEYRYRTVLRGEEQEILSPAGEKERERFDGGEIFTYSIGGLSGMSRGVSELFALADWLDGYEQLLFSILQQERIRSQYSWDLTLEGADEAAIQERMKKLQPPKPLSVRVHNEKEKWSLVGPDVGAGSNTEAFARLFRNHGLGGAAIPEHWYGGGGDVNRAVGAEMAAPAEKSFGNKQKTVKYILEDVFGCQIERGIQTGALPDEEEVRVVTVNMPELSARDLSRAGGALQQTASAFALAGDWISDEVATRVLASLIGQMGVEVDPVEMLEQAKTKRASSLADEASAALDGRARTGAAESE
jgi:hypothetical protein